MLTTVSSYHFSKKAVWAISTLLLAMITINVFLASPKAHAFSPNYNSSNLIDNPTLIDTSTMTPQAIQSLLSNVGSGISNLTDIEACDSNMTAWYTHCGQTVSAAQIIYDASQAYGINPRAVLATMQKEELLVTDPAPSSSQINYAMGFGCPNTCDSAYAGFFTQIDWGTYTLRYNYEGAMRHANWLLFHPASNYPCATGHDVNPNNNVYSTGLYPGNTVTFYNPGGSARTITIANAATASLYCYTPFVGPYSDTGYSGSYNFVYYYQLWFGSTQTSTPYAWHLDKQSAYTDSGLTQPYSDSTVSVVPSGKAYLQVSARNNGYQTWQQSVVKLGTTSPQDRSSIFSDNTWASGSRILMQQTSIIPGETATFNFSITAPASAGSYKECFNVLAENITWMNDPGLCYNIDVVAPQSPFNSSNTGLSSGQSINVNQPLVSPDAHSVFIPQGDGNVVLYGDFSPKWWSGSFSKSASKLTMQTDGNLVLYASDGTPLWNTQTDGNPGAHLVLQTDGNAVVYSSSNAALWATSFYSSSAVHLPNYLNTVNHYLQNAVLYPGQQLRTASGSYHLVLQTDGNLVLYSSSHALWATGTDGKAAGRLAMQSDGNLVLYDVNNKPLWYSGTAGMGPSTLVMQDDGNLVVYTAAGKPTWNTQTNGKS
jgi:hypothetical protein